MREILDLSFASQFPSKLGGVCASQLAFRLRLSYHPQPLFQHQWAESNAQWLSSQVRGMQLCVRVKAGTTRCSRQPACHPPHSKN